MRTKPMALLNLVYRDQLFPREAYRRSFDALLEHLPERQACRTMVDLLAMAHERGCESELADQLDADMLLRYASIAVINTGRRFKAFFFSISTTSRSNPLMGTTRILKLLSHVVP